MIGLKMNKMTEKEWLEQWDCNKAKWISKHIFGEDNDRMLS